MNFIKQTPIMLGDFAIKSVSRIKNRRGQLLSMVSLVPLAACGGGGSPAASTPPPPLGPDYTENPTGTFTGRDNANLTLAQGSATTDLTVNSKDGNDTITTGSGHDIINGAGGNDTIDAGNGNNTVTGGAGSDNITTGDGNDTVDAGDGNNVITDSAGDNRITTGGGDNTITTGSGDDTISVSSGTNSITSGAGNDIITGGTGIDIITTGDGDDTITSGDGNDIIRAGIGNDSVDAGGGDDIILVVGTTGADEYTGTSITNPGGSGMDVSSVLSLAELNDHVTSDAVAGEVIDGGAGSDTLMIYGTVDLSGITILNIENIQVNSTLTLTATQFSQFTSIDGDGSSVLNIINDTGVEPLVLDLSLTSLTGIGTLTTTGNIELIVSSADDLAGIENIVRDGNLTLVLADDSTGTNTINLSDLAAVIGSVDAIEVMPTVTLVVDDTTSISTLAIPEMGGSGTIVVSDVAAADPMLMSGVIIDEDGSFVSALGTALLVEDFGGLLIADIQPSDIGVLPTISIADISVNEAAELATFTVSLNARFYEAVTVDYTAPDGTTGTLTFAAGETSKTFTTAWTDDSTDEADEVVTATLSNPFNATITDASGMLTILDDDTAPTLSIDDISANEADATDTFTVSLSTASGKEVTVDYTAPDGTSGTLTFAAGETSKTFTTAWTDDSIDENNELQTATISNATNAILSNATGSLTIIDDDIPLLSIADVTAIEVDETASFTVSIDQSPIVEVTVDYTAPDGTTGTLTFAAGSTTPQSFSTAWTDDLTDEVNEEVTATLNNATNANILVGPGTLTILDDDGAPSLTITDVTAAEADGSATYTVLLLPASSFEVTVDYTAPDGTTGTLTFAAGVTTQTFTSAWTDDSTDEADEVVTATLSNPSNATISDATGELTIIDDDTAPTISIDDISTNEVDETDTFTVSLSTASGKTITVDYTAPDGTSGTLTFAAGETSKTFTTAWTDDSTDEADEVVTATLSNPFNATITDASGMLTILDDDTAPTISIDDASANEIDETATLTVSLSVASSKTITVDYTLVHDSFPYTLTFAPGETSKTITAVWNDNDTHQTGGTWTYALTNATNATISDSSGILTITDDDPEPTFSIVDIISSRANGTATFIVLLSNPSQFTVTVDYLAPNGTTGTLTFDPTETSQTFTTNWDVNGGDGSDEIVMATLSNAINATIADNSASLTIQDYGAPADSLYLASLDNGVGVTIVGADQAGYAVANAGDVNNDGYDDILISAPYFDANGNYSIGATYVVYGSETLSSTFDLSTINGTNGFKLIGVDQNDFSGRSLSSAGDINGDGYDDIIISAYSGDPNGNNYAGESYIVFGSATQNTSLDLSTLDGSNGFIVEGLAVGDYNGYSVSSAGDINNDGYDDIIIGAIHADPNDKLSAGETYVIFGSTSFPSNFDLSSLDGSNGFIVQGQADNDNSGFSVSNAGDINGDGYDDMIIGASQPNGSGAVYIIYGGTTYSSSIDLSSLDGSKGFEILGMNIYDRFGNFVSGAGDVNGDGYDDIMVSATHADPNGSTDSGEVYIIFGSTNPAASVDVSTLDGSNGFVVTGNPLEVYMGSSTSSAGDINGDGYDDIIIGAHSADPDGVSQAGESYVIYGSESFSAIVPASSLDGVTGYTIKGAEESDEAGWSVSGGGDINGDGFDDLIVGAPNAGTGGESYVIYGTATSADVYMGTVGNDSLSGSVNNERFTGRNGNDTITTGTGSDVLVFDGDWGADTVTDFEDGTDLMDLRDSELTFTDLTITQSGSDTLIEDGLGNSIILTGITSTDITADDFIF